MRVPKVFDLYMLLGICPCIAFYSYNVLYTVWHEILAILTDLLFLIVPKIGGL